MIKQILNKFRRDRRGTIALITAIVLFPLLFLAVGAPIDLARSIQLRSALQNDVDSGALAAEEDIANGATPNQACTMIYDYAVNYIYASGGPGNFAAGASTYPGTSCTNTPTGTTPTPTTATSTGNVPNSATFTAQATLPATFTSFLMKNIPISVSATATGPQGFITVCVTPHGSGSADLDQAYYYLRNTNNTLTNEDGSLINQADAPGLSTGPGPANGLGGTGVEIADFLVDNYDHPSPNGPNVATAAYCDAPADTEDAVTVKSGLGQRLGFEFVVVTGGQYPCYYDASSPITGYQCLGNGTSGNMGAPYTYKPYATSSTLTSGNVNGFEPYYQQYLTGYTTNSNNVIVPGQYVNVSSYPTTTYGTTAFTNAYGTPIGGLNIFYSTDYPSTYDTSNASTNIYARYVNGVLTNVPSVTPVANNSCYEATPLLGSLSPVINGYGPVSQGCLASQLFPNTPEGNYGASQSQAKTVVRWGGQSNNTTNPPTGSYLVCMATDGTTNYNGTAYNAATMAYSGYVSITGTSSSSNIQQENFVIANSSTSGSSLGANIYQCPVNTLGSPYYPDPTCAELGGSTLQVAWNDMGGPGNDNGDSGYAPGGNPPDLYYTYSCQQPNANSVTETALTQ